MHVTILLLTLQVLLHATDALSGEDLVIVQTLVEKRITQFEDAARRQALSAEDSPIVQKLEKRIAELEETVRRQDMQQSRGSRATGAGAGIAFSAILQHDLNNLGPDEPIVFDDIILNDGQGYNNITGAFTVPTDGVYAFMVFIGQRGDNQIYAVLQKNGQLVVELATEGTHSSHDTQAGNAAIMKLTRGDVVQVKHHIWGSHVESGHPLSTFSGFLLYEQENLEIIG